MGNERQAEAWKKGFEAGSDSVFEFLETIELIDNTILNILYIDWCNADK